MFLPSWGRTPRWTAAIVLWRRRSWKYTVIGGAAVMPFTC